MSTTLKRVHGYLAEFSGAGDIYHAAEKVRDAGYQRWADRETDPEVQRLLRLNGREETTHGERVREVMALLAAPR